MLIKKYVVNNMNEALTRIRYELGKDAVIISQRKVKKPGIKGIFSKKQIEVTAAVENSYIENNAKNNRVKNRNEMINNNDNSESIARSIDNIKKVMNNHLEMKKNLNNKTSVSNSKTKNSKSNESLETEVKEMKKMLTEVVKNTNKEYEDKLLDFLNKTDIDLDFYDDIKERLGGNETVENLKKIISEDIEISTDELKHNIVFVGPTGVGKTTTIAKLAGKLALIKKKKVGLITVDTYRIGAVEQLRTYAEIMNIPFEVVITIKEMQQAIDKMKDCDVVLIDTTGRSSKNKMQISELRAFIEKAQPESINVVISSTTKNKDIKTILEGYRVLNYDKVIITKLDETTTYGSFYNISKIAKKPIRFITTGQNVPDDIKDITKEEAIKLIFGEEFLC